MTNREKFQKEILDIACNGDCIAKVNGKLVSCINTLCCDCDFDDVEIECCKMVQEWCEKEYQEVDWSKVKVDTPILVRDEQNIEWEKRYFAYFDVTNNKVYAFVDGGTQWSSDGQTIPWEYAKLAFPENK